MNSKKSLKRRLVSTSGLLFIVLCLTLQWSTPANAAENNSAQNYTQQEIRQRLDSISSSYSVGEYLSDEDAEFVHQYCIPTQASTRAVNNTGSVDIRGSMYGVTVSALGTAYYENTSVLGRAYGANVNVVVNSGATPKNMTFTVHCTAYGAGAEGGLFIVHNGTAPYTAYNTRSFSASPRGAFSGITVFADITTTLSVTTSSGSYFTLESA